VVWRVARPGFSALADDAAGHSSESGIPARYIDDELENAGTVDDLAAAVDAALGNLQTHTM
jgi:hypothetical protein